MTETSKLVERLHRLHPIRCQHDCEICAAKDALVQQAAEIGRLREALRKQSEMHNNDCQVLLLGGNHVCDCRARFARAALAAKERPHEVP